MTITDQVATNVQCGRQTGCVEAPVPVSWEDLHTVKLQTEIVYLPSKKCPIPFLRSLSFESETCPDHDLAHLVLHIPNQNWNSVNMYLTQADLRYPIARGGDCSAATLPAQKTLSFLQLL